MPIAPTALLPILCLCSLRDHDQGWICTILISLDESSRRNLSSLVIWTSSNSLYFFKGPDYKIVVGFAELKGTRAVGGWSSNKQPTGTSRIRTGSGL